MWVTNDVYESRAMHMSHKVQWFEVTSHNMYESPSLPPDASHELCTRVTHYMSHDLYWLEYMSHELLWITNDVYESRTALAGDKNYCTPSCFSGNVSRVLSHELYIWVTNSIYQSRIMLVWVTPHKMYESPCPPPHLSHELCTWVTNYLGSRQKQMCSNTQRQQCFLVFKSRTRYMSHELSIWVTNSMCMSQELYWHELRHILWMSCPTPPPSYGSRTMSRTICVTKFCDFESSHTIWLSLPSSSS